MRVARRGELQRVPMKVRRRRLRCFEQALDECDPERRAAGDADSLSR
jgi:hypothetical protein